MKLSRMKLVSILLGSALLGTVALTCGACDSSSEDAPPGVGTDGGPEGSAPGEGGLIEGGVATPECITAEGEVVPEAARTVDDGIGRGVVETSGAGCMRTFALSSTADRKDNLPTSPRTVAERADRPSLQTNNDLFDALYQLALDEAGECSVSEIKDGAFRNGAALACAPGGCFETGRKWTYVWTRDTAYAVDLGLAWIDPVRAKNSLDFKLSPRRDGSDLQIVQDTGTGGSYPVSTDRVVWALGAREVLRHLTGDARAQFAARTLDAIVNTAAHDRAVAFDADDGLYRGEQSFLDWREQTYPKWTVPDVVHIAESKSLSTNLAHLALLVTGTELAEEKGDATAASDLRAKADALRLAIRTKLWLPEDKQFSTYIPTRLDRGPARRFDLLGTSLAVLLDAATPDQARDAIASYPTLPKGPPVIFPQQKETPIYHNRGIWPFVTAYWVKAARKTGNDAAFDNGVYSLVRGASMNLSNMENLEAVTGKAWVDDGDFSGPVVNSQRQLWSVAGYIGMVHGAVFGVDATKSGLRVAPFMTRGLHRSLFPTTSSLVLNNLPFRGKKVSIVVRLPKDGPAAGGGAYRIASVRVNGASADGGVIEEASLAARNLVEVELAAPAAPAATVKTITDTSNYRVLFAPRTPAITSVALTGDKITLAIDRAGEASQDVTIAVYRDGTRIANGLPGTTTSWQDTSTNGESSPSHCYAVETRYAVSGNVSQRAQPACFWGTGAARITTIPATSFAASGGSLTSAYGRSFFENWGDVGHTLSATFTASRTGGHLVQATYGNGSGAINTGITCAVKRVVVEEAAGGKVVGSGYITMPQRADWASWGDSSFVRADLTSGTEYRVRVEGDARSVNMSAFAHFADYTGGTGGSGGAFFRVNIADVKVLSLVP
jgi:glycogen debranching enzyme